MITDGVVVHERHYAHPIEKVWRTITDRAALATWLMANDASAAVGSRFTLDGGEVFGLIDAEVVELEPRSRVMWSWTIGGRPSVVTIQLRRAGDETVLRLEHRALEPGDAAGFDQGWADKLDTDLVALLANQRQVADVVTRGGLSHHPIFDHLARQPGDSA